MKTGDSETGSRREKRASPHRNLGDEIQRGLPCKPPSVADVDILAHLIAVHPIRRRHVLRGNLVTDGHFAATQAVACACAATPSPHRSSLFFTALSLASTLLARVPATIILLAPARGARTSTLSALQDPASSFQVTRRLHHLAPSPLPPRTARPTPSERCLHGHTGRASSSRGRLRLHPAEEPLRPPPPSSPRSRSPPLRPAADRQRRGSLPLVPPPPLLPAPPPPPLLRATAPGRWPCRRAPNAAAPSDVVPPLGAPPGPSRWRPGLLFPTGAAPFLPGLLLPGARPAAAHHHRCLSSLGRA
uniref:Uncharacterized protein n=1 Tax=Oryza meridionalis TaxID=40149 RepID=A0A0E0EA49_9ORYZ